jgi:hypothetical protein
MDTSLDTPRYAATRKSLILYLHLPFSIIEFKGQFHPPSKQASDSTADILLTTTLPVHRLLAANPCLSVFLVEDENIYAETPVVNGDLATGIWEINSSLSA